MKETDSLQDQDSVVFVEQEVSRPFPVAAFYPPHTPGDSVARTSATWSISRGHGAREQTASRRRESRGRPKSTTRLPSTSFQYSGANCILRGISAKIDSQKLPATKRDQHGYMMRLFSGVVPRTEKKGWYREPIQGRRTLIKPHCHSAVHRDVLVDVNPAPWLQVRIQLLNIVLWLGDPAEYQVDHDAVD